MPAASSFIEVATWREGYLFLGMFLMVLVLPLGIPVHTHQAPRHGSGTTEGHPRAGRRPAHRPRGDAEGT